MISELVARQRAYYATGATRSYGFRKEALAKLAGGLETHQEALYQALQAGLNKTPCESHLSEVGMVRSELRYHQKHLRKWTKPKRMPSAIGQLPGRCNTVPEPYGVTLIMAPWNYPVNLCLTRRHFRRQHRHRKALRRCSRHQPCHCRPDRRLLPTGVHRRGRRRQGSGRGAAGGAV